MAPNPLGVEQGNGEKEGVQVPKTESLLVRVSAWVHKGEQAVCGSVQRSGDTPSVADLEREELATNPDSHVCLTGRVSFALVAHGRTVQLARAHGLRDGFTVSSGVGVAKDRRGPRLVEPGVPGICALLFLSR